MAKDQARSVLLSVLRARFQEGIEDLFGVGGVDRKAFERWKDILSGNERPQCGGPTLNPATRMMQWRDFQLESLVDRHERIQEARASWEDREEP